MRASPGQDELVSRPVPPVVAQLAFAQSGLVSRRQLLAVGVTRWQVVANLRAGRWLAHGRQSIALHTGPLDAAAMRWFGVHEAGPRSALDGHSALEAAGLTGWRSDHVRISVPRGAPAVKRAGLMVRQTRRLRPTDVVGAGVPRVRPAVAAIRAALWVRSDRQAATILAMVVQQRIATPQSIGEALLDVRRHRRRRMLHRVVLDLVGGSQAMGELDFVELCRRHHLPNPDRQTMRRTSRGMAYLDAEWKDFGVVAEIDGIHHLQPDAVVRDALRQNEVALVGSRVVRIPVLGLRVAETAFMAQVRDALVAGGCRRLAS